MIGPGINNIGNKNGFVSVPYVFGDNTIFDHLNTMYYHIHGQPFIYPDKADPILLTSAAGSWDETAPIVEIIPANTITKDFDLHWISVSDISANLFGMIDLFYYDGYNWVLIGPATDVNRTVNFSREGDARVQIPQQLANRAIGARFSDDTTSQRTCRIKVKGHLYE